MSAPAGEFEILAEGGSASEERTLVLASGDAFAVFDRHGELRSGASSRHGLYFDGTRFLSMLRLRIAGRRPLLLSSGILSDNTGLFVHEANPDVRDPDAPPLQRDLVHLVRRIELGPAECRIELSFRSYADAALVLPLELSFAADYVDVFEVRGAHRASRGRMLAPEIVQSGVDLGYVGLDGVTRRTRLRFDPARVRARESAFGFSLDLDPGKSVTTQIRVGFELASPSAPLRSSFASGAGTTPGRDLGASIVTSNAAANAWLRRSAADLEMLTVETPHGPFPYAGVPWFSTPFGRDSLITAYQVMWLAPERARGVLRFLAAHQASESSPERDAEPGKIVHEMRGGEMAALGEIPFGRYYGSVDATPLFLWLAAELHRRTEDDALIEELWPGLERALAWLDGAGDADRDGFVEYARRATHGLDHQGWKDSFDSVMHADGSLARGPIALCEVQAYLYGARRGMARLARLRGRQALARAQDDAADRLREAFARAFWCEDLQSYALALDGDKRPCRVRSSNAGHALLTGIALPEHAAALARTLESSELFSGFGVRTLGVSSPRYNPMSYHDGSVWPHDNSLIAAGLAHHGETRAAASILSALFDASRAMDDARLPELLCGFERRAGEAPTLHPVSCSPQAWAAGAAFLLFRAALGLSIDAAGAEVRLERPVLPAFVSQVTIHDLAIGDSSVDILLERNGDGIDLRVLRRSGTLDVVLAS